jgi:O-acetylhomoserine/O-acetylserine sulfhydrylase-like pyridoxal-dependent enzyme
VSIVASTSFLFNNTEHGADLFALKQLGNIYTRVSPGATPPQGHQGWARGSHVRSL